MYIITKQNNMTKNTISKSWKITDFNVSEERLQFYKDLDKNRMAIGREICGKTKKQHFQIYICFKRAYRWNALKKILGDEPHFEKAIVNDWNYELKDMDYIIENNSQGKRNDLAKINGITKIRDAVDELNYQGIRHAELRLKYKEEQRKFKPEVIWISGETGVGKSKYVYDKHDDVFVPINFKWWEGYDAHEVVIIDDFRKDFCKFHELLKLLDRYPYRVETKGGSRQLLAKFIYITSPYSIEETFCNRSDEDINQLYRRVTQELRITKNETVTEVKKGNTSFLDMRDIEELK